MTFSSNDVVVIFFLIRSKENTIKSNSKMMFMEITTKCRNLFCFSQHFRAVDFINYGGRNFLQSRFYGLLKVLQRFLKFLHDISLKNNRRSIFVMLSGVLTKFMCQIYFSRFTAPSLKSPLFSACSHEIPVYPAISRLL